MFTFGGHQAICGSGGAKSSFVAPIRAMELSKTIRHTKKQSRQDSTAIAAVSQMCTLLSQYLKENGGFGDLKLVLNHTAKPKVSATKPMDLFPIIDESGHGSGFGTGSTNPNMLTHMNDTRKNSFPCGPETAQMTIFYDGQVMVFVDLLAD